MAFHAKRLAKERPDLEHEFYGLMRGSRTVDLDDAGSPPSELKSAASPKGRLGGGGYGRAINIYSKLASRLRKKLTPAARG